MKKKLKVRKFNTVSYPDRKWRLLLTKGFLFLWIIFAGLPAFAQNTQIINGKVVDDKGEALPGVSIVLKNNATVGAITDGDGNFSLTVPSGKQTLTVSFLGMVTQEIVASGTSPLNIVMKEDTKQLSEVVVVGFGTQKKESVVGAIAQTSGKVLERTGGVSDLGAALTGNLPGVVTISTTGRPGDEDPRIVIRSSGSWNNTDPLVLVDGIERPMSTIDINSVESISVLKDASATAVFGVRGANGVILITTKRGQEGKAVISFNFNSTVKTPSKLPQKYDSYDALMYLNQSIESEMAVNPNSWSEIYPYALINKYRNPANQAEADRFPNVDWQKATLNDYAMAYNANMNISGGTKFVKYFTNLDYQNEGDLYRQYNNNRGYQPGFGYQRINVRSNLDFTLTPSTTLKVGLSGSHGIKKEPEDRRFEQTIWRSIYWTAPDAMQVIYSNGMWGYHAPNSASQTQQNSVQSLAISGIEYLTTDRINTNFSVDQDLSKLVKGLSARFLLAFDNEYQEARRGVNDRYVSDSPNMWINPRTGQAQYSFSVDANNLFDWQENVGWTAMNGSIDASKLFRRLYYSFQLNYANTFLQKHNVTAMGDFNREETATGSIEPSLRENWVFRATYDFERKYLLEYNGSYNGSEKFAAPNRFVFFQSGAVGWNITEEQFIRNLNLNWMDMLKLRASYGQIGDDMIQFGSRWPYMTTWDMRTNVDPPGDYRFMQTLTGGRSPYNVYYESGIGNENIHWETVSKFNFGIDYSFLKNVVSGNLEFFNDKRRDIFIAGANRSVPSYFGAAPASTNMGAVDTKGYELELRLNKQLNKNLRLWGNFAYSHAKSKVLERDDPQLLPTYMKQAGFTIDQTRSHVDVGYINNWDELYGSTAFDATDNLRTPGGYMILDFNGDGVIDKNDQVPVSFSTTPENTFNVNLGADYKGWSVFAQFYGVTNVDRYIPYVSFEDVTRHTIFKEGTYWSKDNQNADGTTPRMWALLPAYAKGTRYLYDGSFLRLKNVELGYTFTNDQRWVKKIGVTNFKLYVNGNNLWLYTKMPDDREANYGNGATAADGAYPTMKRINFGLRISL